MRPLKYFGLLLVVSLSVNALPALDLDWEPIGPSSGWLTCLHADETGTALFAGSIEGFWYYTHATASWTQREDVGWIGRQVWSLASLGSDPGTVITGRENAFFKGYLEWTDDWGVTSSPAYMSDGGSVKDVKELPGSPGTFVACTWSDVAPGELLRSTDGGITWGLLAGGHYAMTELAVDPNQPGTLYLSGSDQVTKSTDGGDSWAAAGGGLPTGLGVYCVSCSPHDSQLLLCSNDDGIYRSTDGGGSWAFVPSEVGLLDCQHFAFSPSTPGLAAAVTFSPYRLIVSEDGGETWADASGDLAGESLTDTVFAPDGETLYVSTYDSGLFAAAVGGPGTVGCSYACAPASGTVPFTVQHQAVLQNRYKDQARRAAARIDVTLANGTVFGSWRAGFTNIAPLSQYTAQWNSTLPALGTVIGDNIFRLTAEDVTPAPYNQPPYPPSGDTATASCMVTGIAP